MSHRTAFRAAVCGLVAALCAGAATRADDSKGPPVTEKRQQAPELSGGAGWINTDRALTLADLRGKIVLLDFWTFC